MLLKLGGVETLTYIASMRDAVLGRWCRIKKNEVGVVRGQVGGQQVAEEPAASRDEHRALGLHRHSHRILRKHTQTAASNPSGHRNTKEWR
jgi:hypothetical protein